MSTWSSQLRALGFPRRATDTSVSSGAALIAFLGVALLVRVLTDDQASPESRHSGSLDLSGGIAAILIVLAIWLLLRRRGGVLPSVLAALWLCIWTLVAVGTSGASPETLREGVREGSALALAVIVYNTRGAITASTATRLVQIMGALPALIALLQVVTHGGMYIGGHLRSNGTFATPDSAAMFFAIAATASLWRYLDLERRLPDALLTALFAGALIATLSIDGLATLIAMLVALGALRPGSVRDKRAPWLVAGLVVLSFLATPFGLQRLTRESSTNLATAERDPNTSLAWRLHKWKTLIPEWQASPIAGRGLGTTTTTVPVRGNRYSGKPPHNEYLRYLVETGVIGLTTLLGSLVLLIRGIARRRPAREARQRGIADAPALALAVITGCLVNALADNTFLNSPTCYAVALIAVAVLGLPALAGRPPTAPRAL